MGFYYFGAFGLLFVTLLYTNRAVEVVEITFGVICKPHKWSQINHTLYVLKQRESNWRNSSLPERTQLVLLLRGKCNMWTMLIISKRGRVTPHFGII
ncbi:hypothetical protein J3E68DRAFT_201312 [Trichoderma sp. SZMC 28012]